MGDGPAASYDLKYDVNHINKKMSLSTGRDKVI